MAWREDAAITKLKTKDLTVTNSVTTTNPLGSLTVTNLTVSGTLTATPLATQVVTLQTATRLKLGAAAAEIPTSVTFGFAKGAANIAEVLITAVNSAGTTIARVLPLTVWLSDADTGVGLTGTTASGTVKAKSASGTDVGALTAKKALAVHTLAAGTYTLEITDTSKTAFYVGVMLPCGLIVVSRVMTSADYG